MSKCNPVPAKKAASGADRIEPAEGIEAEAGRTAGVCGRGNHRSLPRRARMLIEKALRQEFGLLFRAAGGFLNSVR
jgi:predicted Rossmann fold nucleotide-binding protein DprA/Smf involved in DNA uptake